MLTYHTHDNTFITFPPFSCTPFLSLLFVHPPTILLCIFWQWQKVVHILTISQQQHITFSLTFTCPSVNENMQISHPRYLVSYSGSQFLEVGPIFIAGLALTTRCLTHSSNHQAERTERKFWK